MPLFGGGLVVAALVVAAIGSYATSSGGGVLAQAPAGVSRREIRSPTELDSYLTLRARHPLGSEAVLAAVGGGQRRLLDAGAGARGG